MAAKSSGEIGSTFDGVYVNVSRILNEARNKAYRAIDTVMLRAYWEIGRVIVEEEQQGKTRAEYGRQLIQELSRRLTTDYGKGYSKRNLEQMRRFYLEFQIAHAVRAQLTWTHFRMLMRLKDENARSFYLIEASRNSWSTRELDRQINSLLFERLALSRDKDKVLKLALEGQTLQNPGDLIKDPYVLEFLGMGARPDFHEKDLEQGLIDRLQAFLLELGRGFALVGRQKRITVGGEHFYIDLVFYNHLLRCFVLIDLKIGKLDHRDIGQMDFYVRYFEEELRPASDNPTIVLILCSERNEAAVKYTLLKDSERIFAPRYKLYLPSEEELASELAEARTRLELEKG